MKKRPLAVTIISWIYIVAGIGGIAYHAREFNLQHPFETDAILALSVRALAIVAGIVMLRGRDWARWLAVAWMGFHVILSIYHPLPQLVIHAVFLVLLAFFLFRPEARQYFRDTTGTTE
jgi:hypothetical protein